MSTFLRRAGVPLAAAALLSSTLGVAAADPLHTDDPVEAAAGWLTTQLHEGTHVFNEEFGFADAGLTADIVYALAAAGVAGATARDAIDWLEDEQAAAYSAFGPGATAKLILVAEVADRDPRSFGGVDLVTALEDLEDANGLYTTGAWDSTLNQSLAVLALARVDGTDPSADAVDFLLDQQCDDGGFRNQVEGEGCAGGVDTTAFAVQALLAVGDTPATDAAHEAVTWLTDVQDPDGSFVGDGVASSNSTGLAALALEIGGEQDAAARARDWVLGLQVGCDDDDPGAILADADGAGETLRATPQAILGLVGDSLSTIELAGAADGAALLDCPPVTESVVEDEQTEVEDDPEPVDDVLADGMEVDESEPTEVDDEAEELPATGGRLSPAAMLAALLLAGGALLLVSTHRRSIRA